MAKIRQLSAHVVNKIAAGEVIERPASVVKELVENSLDAGATRIDVTLEQGGIQRIRVSDNGHGMLADDLPLAIASHATSKIRGDDELFSVRTLGFRGEALASIASVSRFRLESRTAETDGGCVLQVEGGTVHEGVLPCGGPVGTRVEVNDLFFNTPVRRKFLRTTQTEVGHVTEAITRLALAFPQVHFVLRHHDRTLYDLPPTDRWRDRIAAFFGRELAEHLLWIEHHDDDLKLEGFVAEPAFTRANPRLQYFFLNQRHIRDRSLQHALTEAYRGLIMVGRYPIAFLRLDMPPELVDVNVHPTKLEVRFQDGGRIYSRILGTLRNKFLTSDITKAVSLNTPYRVDDASRLPGPAGSHVAQGLPSAQGLPVPTRFAGSTARLEPGESTGAASLPWEAGAAVPLARPLPFPELDPKPITTWSDLTPHPAAGAATDEHDSADHLPTIRTTLPPPPLPALPASPTGAGRLPPYTIGRGSDNQEPVVHRMADEVNHGPLPTETITAAAEAGTRSAGGGGEPRLGIQVHQRYLVCESEAGIVVIDQHALHERILYEKLRERVARGGLERQQLLVPEPVELMPEEAAALLDARDMLHQLAVGIEEFGGSTLVINFYPAILRHFRPDRLLKELAEMLLTGKRQLAQDDVLDQLLHTMACKAAVKAGDRLTPDEVTALLEQRGLVQDWHHCPHGRPTTLVFKRAELDRYFGRT